MNVFFLVVVIAVIGIAFWFQKQNDKGHEADTRAAIELAEQSGASPQPTAAPGSQPSPHTYMKRALDRARDVRDEARQRTETAQEP